MEECIDQNVEIIHPAPEHATFVSRATSELCKRHGPSAVVSMPLRQAGEPIAVLTVHRPVDRPFSLEELESLRLACDLCTPRVAVLNEHDRWFGSKLASGTRKALGWAVGNKHTWAKLIVIIVLAVGLFISRSPRASREAGGPVRPPGPRAAGSGLAVGGATGCCRHRSEQQPGRDTDLRPERTSRKTNCWPRFRPTSFLTN